MTFLGRTALAKSFHRALVGVSKIHPNIIASERLISGARL